MLYVNVCQYTPSNNKSIHVEQRRKMENLKYFSGVLLAAVVGYFIGKAVLEFITILSEISNDVLAAIISAVATILIGLFTITYTQYQINIRNITEAHRTKKVEIYETYLKTISAIMLETDPGDADDEDNKVTHAVLKFKKEIVLWGSPEVIKCQVDFNTLGNTDTDTDTDTYAYAYGAIDNMCKAIRKDIGLSNKGLDNRELLKIYANSAENAKLLERN